MPSDGRPASSFIPENHRDRTAEAAPYLAISATFTAEAIQPALSFWFGEVGLGWDVRFAPYNQVFQQLLDPASLLARNAAGANAVLVRFEDWGPGAGQHAVRLLDALRAVTVPVVLVVCPPTPAHAGESECGVELLRRGLAGMTHVHLIAPEDLDALYPVAEPLDPHADQLGRVPYTPLYFAALGTMLVRKLHAVRSAPFKVIALDCDDTLWQGICGEDGPHGVVLDPPRRALQEFMRVQREAGMLLALCSKNNEDDVAETFAAHPEFPLAYSDFAARRINWEPKSANLASLAEELSLGVDSFILVDDNAKECTETQSACPDALALPLPVDPDEIPAFLQHVWAFDHARVTEEDRRRSALYEQQAARTRLARSATNLEEFVTSLGLQVRIAPLVPELLPRAAQLTQRTNQMNCTSIRRTEAALQQLAPAECLTVDVADRFGSYGVTGLVVFRTLDTSLEVDTFLLSCRVLGRGVEHRVLARLGEIASERGLEGIRLLYSPTARNRPARLFLESVARTDEGGVYYVTAAAAAAVRYRPGKAKPVPGAASSEPAPATAPRTRIDYAELAALRDPATIYGRIQAARPAAATPRAGTARPRTLLEQELAALWCELLHLPELGIHDNFFEFGGHSLLAVQLLSRVRQMCGVDLSLEVVYSGDFTIAELAKAVELKEIEQAAGGEYQDLLQELEGLSDAEVRELLAQEEAAQGGSHS
jgi:FkbH-like protein